MPDQQTAEIAALIDFEKISLSETKRLDDFDLGLALKAIQRHGHITLKRADGDWSRLGAYREGELTAELSSAKASLLTSLIAQIEAATPPSRRQRALEILNSFMKIA